MELPLFYVFGAAMLTAAGFVVAARNPVYSAMSLLVLFFFMAGVFVLLGAYFLATIQVLVYAGAVIVLFLFVIMFLDLSEVRRRRLHLLATAGGLGIAALFLASLSKVVAGARDTGLPAPGEGVGGTVAEIGRSLFLDAVIPFEVTSLLLLAAMIGVIVLSRRAPGGEEEAP